MMALKTLLHDRDNVHQTRTDTHCRIASNLAEAAKPPCICGTLCAAELQSPHFVCVSNSRHEWLGLSESNQSTTPHRGTCILRGSILTNVVDRSATGVHGCPNSGDAQSNDMLEAKRVHVHVLAAFQQLRPGHVALTRNNTAENFQVSPVHQAQMHMHCGIERRSIALCCLQHFLAEHSHTAAESYDCISSPSQR
jgi:hypothetical protein